MTSSHLVVLDNTIAHLGCDVWSTFDVVCLDDLGFTLEVEALLFEQLEIEASGETAEGRTILSGATRLCAHMLKTLIHTLWEAPA